MGHTGAIKILNAKTINRQYLYLAECSLTHCNGTHREIPKNASTSTTFFFIILSLLLKLSQIIKLLFNMLREAAKSCICHNCRSEQILCYRHCGCCSMHFWTCPHFVVLVAHVVSIVVFRWAAANVSLNKFVWFWLFLFFWSKLFRKIF